MTLFGPIFAPLLDIGALSTLTAVLLWCNVCSLGCDPSLPYTPIRRTILMGGMRVCSRTLLLCYGFPWIRVMYETDKEEEEKGKEEMGRQF